MNKRSFKQDEVTPKKRFKMHKRKKQWIVLAVAFLSFLGGSGVVSVTCGGEVAYAEVTVDSVPKAPIKGTPIETSRYFTIPELGNETGQNSAQTGIIGQSNVVMITPDKQKTFGVLWSNARISLETNFSYSSYIYMAGDGGDYGDGMAFVLQNDPLNDGLEAHGGAGGALGVYKNPSATYSGEAIENAVAIEFDTFMNSGLEDKIGIPAESLDKAKAHIALQVGNENIKAVQEGDINRIYKAESHKETIAFLDKKEMVGSDNGWVLFEVHWIVDKDTEEYTIEWTYGTSEKKTYTFTGEEKMKEVFGLDWKEKGVRLGFTGATGGSHQLNLVALTEMPLNMANIDYKTTDGTPISEKIASMINPTIRTGVAQDGQNDDWKIAVATYNVLPDRKLVGYSINGGDRVNINPEIDKDIVIAALNSLVKPIMKVELFYDDGIVKDAIKNAKDKIDQLKEKQQTAVEDLKDKLSAEDLAKIDDNLNTEQQKAKDLIDAGETLQEVAQAEKTGEEALQKVVDDAKALVAARDMALAELDQKAAEIKEAIESIQGLTGEEKEKAKVEALKQLDNEPATTILAVAKGEVKQATSEAEVWTQVAEGKEKMDQIYQGLLAQSDRNSDKIKGKYIQDVLDAADKAKSIVNQQSNLTQKEKEDYKAKIDEAKAQALKDIPKATTQSVMEDARDKAVTAIEKVAAEAKLQNEKHQAETYLEKKAKETNAAIDALVGVDETARIAAKTRVETACKDAVEQVKNSGNTSEIEACVVAGEKAMDAIYTELLNSHPVTDATLENARNKAKEELNATAELVRDQINAMKGLSEAEKVALVGAVGAEKAEGTVGATRDTAAGKITEAQNAADITKEKATGQANIQAILKKAELENAKSLAIQETQAKSKAVQTALDALTAVNGVTQADIDAAKAQVNALSTATGEEAVVSTIKEIKTATSVADVEAKAKAGRDAMDQAYKDLVAKYDTYTEADLVREKERLNQALTEAIEKGQAAIEGLTHLAGSKEEPGSEKDTALAKVEALAQEAKDAINAIDTTETDVDVAKDALKKAEEKLQAAEQAIDEHVKAQTVIDYRKAAEKALQAHANQLNTAIDEIRVGTEEPGSPLEAAIKDAAKNKIGWVAEESVPGSIYADAIAELEKAETIEAIQALETAKKLAMDAVYDGLVDADISQLKARETARVNEIADKALETINQSPKSETEKNTAKLAVEAERKKANDAIADAKTPSDIARLKGEGDGAIVTNAVEEIANIVKPFAEATAAAELKAVKKAAKEEIVATSESLKAQIKDLGLTGEAEKAANDALAAIEKIAKKAEDDNVIGTGTGIEAIDAAGTSEAVKDAVTTANQAMNDLYKNLVKSEQIIFKDNQKQSVKETGEKAKDVVNALVDQDSSLPEDEKVKKKKTQAEAIDTLVKEVEKQIDGTSDMQQVLDFVKSGNASVTDFTKDFAKEQLQAKSNEIAGKIDELYGADADAIAKAKNKLAEKLQAAEKAVDEASLTPSTTIPQLVKEGKQTMDDLFAALEAQKTAKEAVDEATQKEIEKIDPKLPGDEKQELEKKIQEEGEKTKETIDQAETAEQVEAIQAVVAEANRVKDVIEGLKSGLSSEKAKELNAYKDQVDTAKKDALEKIITGKTSEAVKDAKEKGIQEIQAIEKEAQEAAKKAQNQQTQDAEFQKEKETVKKEIEALPNVDNSNLDEELAKAQDSLALQKLLAKKEIESAANEILNRLAAENSSLTTQEKDLYQKLVTSQAGNAVAEIQGATELAGVESAKEQGVKTLGATDLEVKELEIKHLIENSKLITDKVAGISKLAEILEAVKSTVADAADLAATKDAISNGKKDMTDFYNTLINAGVANLENAKDKNKEDINQEAEQAIQDIQDLSPLEKPAKDQKIKEIEKARDKAKDQIDAAETITGAGDQKTAGAKELDKIVEKARVENAVLQGKEDLKAKHDELIGEDGTSGKLAELVNGDKEQARAEIEKAYEEALKQLDAAAEQEDATVERIEAVVTAGEQAMDDAYNKARDEDEANLAAAKEKAKADILRELEKAQDRIELLKDLTDKQLTDLQDELQGIADQIVTGKEGESGTIDAAADIKKVDEIVTDGKKEIAELLKDNRLWDRQNAAIAKLNAKAEKANKEGGDLERLGLPAAELQDAKDEIIAARDAAIKKVEASVTEADVKTALDNGEELLDAIYNKYAEWKPAPVIPTPTPTPTPTPSTPVTPTPTTPTTPSLPGTSTKVTAVQLYRAYNPNNGEHLYTADQAEYQHVVSAGWQDEGLAWKAVSSGDAVYRLYNPNSGEHFYTLDVEEYEKVAAAGWRKEGLVFYSNVEKAVPVYRLFNPNAHDAGSHHFTTDAKERDALVALGWNDEGIAFYGME